MKCDFPNYLGLIDRNLEKSLYSVIATLDSRNFTIKYGLNEHLPITQAIPLINIVKNDFVRNYIDAKLS